MNRFFGGLGRFVVRYRFLVVIAWIIIIGVSGKTLPSLGSEVNNDNSQFLPASAPSSVAANLATPILGNPNFDSVLFVVAGRTDHVMTPADIATLGNIAKAVNHVPRIIGVRELGLSADRRAARIFVSIRVNQADINGQVSTVNALEQAIRSVPAPSGLAVHLAGGVATNVANQASSNAAGSKTQKFSLLFIVILLLLIFRSVLAPLITLIPAAVALAVSTRFIGGLGAHGLKISQITELLLIVLLLGAGTDYGLFLVFRVREEIRRGMEAREAVVFALVRVGESISASAGTVIFALLSLLLATFGIYQDLGIPLALGIAVILLAGLTLLPALLAIFGSAVFWPSHVRSGDTKIGLWGRVAGRLLARPGRTLLIGLVVFAGLASAALGYRSAGFGGALDAPPGTDAAAGNAILSAHFPEANTNPANLVFRYAKPVWDDPTVLMTLEAKLESSGQFTQLAGPLDPNGTTISATLFSHLHQLLGAPAELSAVVPAGLGITEAQYNAYRATAQYVSIDGRTVQFETNDVAGDQQSSGAMDATPEVRAIVTDAGKASGATAAGVAGEAAALYDVSQTSNHDLTRIVPIAVIAIGLLLALVLRSLIAPIYLIVSVVLSYLAALGVSTLVFVDIGGQQGLTFILPFLMFIFLLALGEDYNILVMTRIREEAHRQPLRTAVIEAVTRTGSTVTSAGLVLAGTFGVLAVTGGSGPSASEIRVIGFGLAIGVLMDTFVVRTLIVPSAAALLGRWNWWPRHVEIDETGESSPLGSR